MPPDCAAAQAPSRIPGASQRLKSRAPISLRGSLRNEVSRVNGQGSRSPTRSMLISCARISATASATRVVVTVRSIFEAPLLAAARSSTRPASDLAQDLAIASVLANRRPLTSAHGAAPAEPASAARTSQDQRDLNQMCVLHAASWGREGARSEKFEAPKALDLYDEQWCQGSPVAGAHGARREAREQRVAAARLRSQAGHKAGQGGSRGDGGKGMGGTEAAELAEWSPPKASAPPPGPTRTPASKGGACDPPCGTSHRRSAHCQRLGCEVGGDSGFLRDDCTPSRQSGCGVMPLATSARHRTRTHSAAGARLPLANHAVYGRKNVARSGGARPGAGEPRCFVARGPPRGEMGRLRHSRGGH